MQIVWTRDELPVDEKIRIFNDELNNLKRRYDLLTKPKPMEVIVKKEKDDDTENQDIVQENVTQSV